MSRGYNDYHPDGVLSFLRPGGLGFFHAFSLKAPPLGGAFFMVSNSYSKVQHSEVNTNHMITKKCKRTAN